MSDENKAVVRRYIEEFVGSGNFEVADEIFADHFHDHTALPGEPANVEGLTQFFKTLGHGFSDHEIIMEDILAEDDRVAVRFTFRGTHDGAFMGIPPTGNHVTIEGIDIMRVHDGKIAELWGQENVFSLLQQTGALPDF